MVTLDLDFSNILARQHIDSHYPIIIKRTAALAIFLSRLPDLV